MASRDATRWIRQHKVTSAIIALMTVSAIVTGAILLRQDVTTTSSAQVSDVQFVNAGGGLAGFATLSVDTSGASATLTLTGVSGASMQVTSLLQLQNTDATQAYDVTLSRSAAPNGAITGLTFTVLNGATTIETYNAATTATGTQFNLPVSTTYDIRIDMDVADGTAAGSLGSFTLEFSIAPA